MLQSASLPSCHTSLFGMEKTDQVICAGMSHTALSWGRESRWCLGHTQLQAAKAKEELSLSGDISLSCVSCRTHELHVWELSVPFRSGKSGKAGRTLGGPEPCSQQGSVQGQLE